MIRGEELQETTHLLVAWQRGDREAGDALLRRVYPDLHRLSSGLLGRYAAGVSLEPSDLIQDLYLKLAAQERNRWESRGQFFGVVARLLRRLLIDHARHRGRQRRGGGAVRVTLDLDSTAAPAGELDQIALGQALDRLAEIDASAARLVELKFFLGLSLDEISDALGIARSTVARRWRYARSWLLDALAPVA